MMKLRRIISLTLVFLMFFSVFVCSETNTIACSTVIDGTTITINGTLEDAIEAHNVMLLVGDWNNIIHIDQVESDSNGNFTFQFNVPETLPSGYYNFQVGTDAGYATYYGFFCYAVTLRKPVMEAQLTLAKVSGVPIVSGEVYCAIGKELAFHLINQTDNTIIANDVVTSADGVTRFEYQLPELQNLGLNDFKDYELLISCTDGSSLMNISMDIHATVFLLNFNGIMETADNVDAEVQFHSVNTNLVDKNLMVTGEYQISKSIPSIAANESFDINIKVFESKLEEIIQLQIGDIAAVGIQSQNIANTEDTVFQVTYNSEQLELVDVIGNTYEKELTEGTYGDITVLSIEDGSIRFQLNNAESHGSINGIVNIIKFKVHSEDAIQVNVTYE